MDLEKLLRTDFSNEAHHKQETLNGLLETIENGSQVQQHERMYKVMKKRKTAGILAACLVVLLSVTALAFGGDIFRSAKVITVGEYARYNLMGRTQRLPITSEQAGKSVDKKSIVPKTNAQQIEDGRYTIIESKEDVRQYTMFDFKTPSYIPDGYELVTYIMFNSKNGQPYTNSKYLGVEYKNENGDVIYCQLRYMDEETAFEMSAGSNAGKVNINGYEAVLSDENIAIEIDSILYMFDNGIIGRDELIKIATSLQ